jgi:hypothetical protein
MRNSFPEERDQGLRYCRWGYPYSDKRGLVTPASSTLVISLEHSRRPRGDSGRRVQRALRIERWNAG